MSTSSNSQQKKLLSRIVPILFLVATTVGSSMLSTSVFSQVGLMPVPTLQGVQVQANASFDPGTQLYSFTYTISNPVTNTGNIWNIKVDVTTKGPQALDVTGLLSIPLGPALKPFNQELADYQPLPLPAGTSVVPFGLQPPPGWIGSLGGDGVARFSETEGLARVGPGQTRSGFVLISGGVPTLRQMQVRPAWAYVVPNIDVIDDDEAAAAAQIEQSITFTTLTLGPSDVTPGFIAHWDQLQRDLNQVIQLGFVTDATLANALVAQLASARQALDAQDGTTAKARLQTLIQTIMQATPAQRRQEVVALVLLNAQALVANTQDTIFPSQPQVTLTPQTASLSLGALYTLTATEVNLGDPAHPPVSGVFFRFIVHRGPQIRLISAGTTDAQGKVSFSYTGTEAGTDMIDVLRGTGEGIRNVGSAQVTWSGGPDLVVPLFGPPTLQTQGGKTIFVTEWTGNTGTLPAAASTTRYFISATTPVDPTTARVIGERGIPALAPGSLNKGGAVTFTLPADLAAGVYFLAACADADNVVVELNELNNCSFNKVLGMQSLVIPMLLTNLPPDCSKASPSVALLWPPNQKFVAINIQGVTDPDGDLVTLTVTGITQDEPVHEVGSGNTGPDGVGVGTPQAQVRAERSGTGNGRLYFIAFTADDGKGATCTSTVTVGVPHDQGQHSTPIDTGKRFDSTQP